MLPLSKDLPHRCPDPQGFCLTQKNTRKTHKCHDMESWPWLTSQAVLALLIPSNLSTTQPSNLKWKLKITHLQGKIRVTMVYFSRCISALWTMVLQSNPVMNGKSSEPNFYSGASMFRFLVFAATQAPMVQNSSSTLSAGQYIGDDTTHLVRWGCREGRMRWVATTHPSEKNTLPWCFL